MERKSVDWLFMLNELSKRFDKENISLYRDALRELVPFVQFKKCEKFGTLLKVSSQGPTVLHICFCSVSINSMHGHMVDL